MLLKFAVKDFLDDREYKNVSAHTLYRYKKVLDEFQNFIAKEEVLNVEEVTSNLIKSYLLHCQNERGNNVTTKNTKLRALKTFFNYLVECEYIDEKRNPAKKIGYAKEDVQIEVFTEHHIKQMLAYYRNLKKREKSFFSYRDHTMIVFLLGTGVRLGELCNLKWNDVNFEHGTITVFGKKREQSSVPLTEKLLKELAEWKIYCQQKFHTPLEYVFTNSLNRKLTPNAVKCVFKRLKNVMDFKDVRVSAHTFRHTFAVRCVRNGMDVFTLQKLLRHKKLEMTMIYVNMFGTALKEQNDKFNPLNTLDI